MPYEIGFDREKYIQMQSEHIQKRRAEVGGKLYLEMGGKLFDDNHASRVLPGFTPDNKIAMLDRIKDEVEIVICFNAGDVVRQKMRADLGITYEDDVLRLVDVFRDRGFWWKTWWSRSWRATTRTSRRLWSAWRGWA